MARIRVLSKTGFIVFAVGLHLAAALFFTMSSFTEYSADRPHVIPSTLEIQDGGETVDEHLERDVFENEKEINIGDPPIEDPVIKDCEISEHNEDGDALSDKPFQGKYWNSAIGIGGGSGGAMGARYGGRTSAKPGESYTAAPTPPPASPAHRPLSTVSVDVDTASYSNVRRMLKSGHLPPENAVRVEEMINYFPYGYPDPDGDDPVALHAVVTDCPWNMSRQLVRIGLQARRIDRDQRPPSNLVFLIDVSGSMSCHNKLPLLKAAFQKLVRNLYEGDFVSIVTYANRARVVLPSTPATSRAAILNALGQLQARGGTNGQGGIQMAYEQAAVNFLEGGVNRVILATDGDFNVGITDTDELLAYIRGRADQGTHLTVLGFGMGNLKDDRLEKLADKGDGNYAYIDTVHEAEKALVTQMSGTLVTVAKDVKVQVEFNPARVASWRLVGYENRRLADRDFNDDKKDAGEVGAGHSVTFLYEIVRGPATAGDVGVDALKYQSKPSLTSEALSTELLTVKIRYKQPEGGSSRLLAFPVQDSPVPIDDASWDVRFAAAVAEFGMLLKNSPHKGTSSFAQIAELASEAADGDGGFRREFTGLVAIASRLSGAR